MKDLGITINRQCVKHVFYTENINNKRKAQVIR